MLRLLLALLLATPCFAQFLWNKSHLQQVRTSLKSKKSPYVESFNDLISDAQDLLKQKDVSIIDKKRVSVSGDKHDYVSLSRYYWPNPRKSDGLPYIARDGVSNPELKEYDRENLDKMSRRVQTLTLAWFLSRDTTFASAALKQVRIWFIDDSTKMNPNMNYAQMIPGRNNGKGHAFGVLDGYSITEMLGALKLLESYKRFTKADKKSLKKWFTEYVQWLTTSEQGIEESNAKNNHGTTYDTQLLAYSLYTGDRKTAKELIKNFAQRHILTQIELDGTQPAELKRTLAFHYSWYNLSHMLDFYTIAKNNGLDFSKATQIEGHSYFKALDFLAEYIGKDVEQWPYQQISGWEHVQEELIRDFYRTYTLIPKKKNYREIYRNNKEKAAYNKFKLLHVKKADL